MYGSGRALASGTIAMRFENYEVGDFFDEMFGEQGAPRALARALVRNIESLRASC